MLLAFAVVNVSFASILVRLAYGLGVHGFAAASWRLIFSSIITLLILVIVYRGI